MAGRSPGSVAIGFQGVGRSLHDRRCRLRVGSRTVVRSCRHPTGSGSTEVCCGPKSVCPPGVLLPTSRERCPHAGDHRRGPPQGLPHRRRPGLAQPPAQPATHPRHPGGLPAAAPVGRTVAGATLGGRGRSRDRPGAGQRLVGDGEHVLDVPAKLAARVRVLSVGHGRKSDPDDAVSWRSPPAAPRPCGRSGSRTRRWCCTC
jgi:hypothetical protein